MSLQPESEKEWHADRAPRSSLSFLLTYAYASEKALVPGWNLIT